MHTEGYLSPWATAQEESWQRKPASQDLLFSEGHSVSAAWAHRSEVPWLQGESEYLFSDEYTLDLSEQQVYAFQIFQNSQYQSESMRVYIARVNNDQMMYTADDNLA